MDYVLRRPIRTVTALLGAAVRRREEQKAWSMWLSLYPHMVLPSPYTKEQEPMLKFVPFSRFWAEQAGPQTRSQGHEPSREEIIARFEAAKERHQRSKGIKQ